MAPPAQALLTALVAKAVFGDNDEGEDLVGDAKMGEVTTLKADGVEIIINEAGGGNSHAVYPHFGDRPEDNLVGAHAVYPTYDSAHAMYPAFGDDSGGLIGEKVKNDESIKHHGVEIIASNGADGSIPHAVYPHFGDKPEESLLGAHAVYPAFDSCQAMHPVFRNDSGGLIGEAKNDESIEHLGVEIITSNGANGSIPHAVYPHFGDKPEESLLGAHAVYPALDSCHAMYPVFGDDSGGLIGEKAKNDESIEHLGVEIIAGSGADRCTRYAIYADVGGKPEEVPFGGHAMYPTLVRDSSGLIGDENKDEAILEKIGDEIIAGNIGNEESTKGNIESRNHMHMKMIVAEDLGMKAPPDILTETVSHETSKGKGVSSRTASFLDGAALKGLRAAHHLSLFTSRTSAEEKNDEAALLVAAFLALPREQVLHAMNVAILQVDGKPSWNSGQTCTGVWAQGERLGHAAKNWQSMPQLVAATT